MERTAVRTLLGLASALALAVSFTSATLDAQWGSDYSRLRCESKDGGDEYCRAPISGDVHVVRQLSDRACIEGRTWRWDRNGISVRDGCRAEFEYRRRDGGSSGSSGGGWGTSGGGWGGSGGGWGGGGNRSRITCQSVNDRDQFCSAPIAGDVWVVRQLSGQDCVEGRTWRWDRNGITVRDGCRAEFEYRRRDGGSSGSGGWGGSGGGWGGSGGSWGGGGRRDRVTCQSQKDREQFCPAPVGGDVRIVRQMSDEECVYRKTWNWNQDGIRVYGGCRAEFEYTRRSEGSGGIMSRVTCQSEKDRTQFCPAPIGGDVRVFRNISDTRCREGQNWSWSRDGVRVWNGCRAEFEYRQRN